MHGIYMLIFQSCPLLYCTLNQWSTLSSCAMKVLVWSHYFQANLWCFINFAFHSSVLKTESNNEWSKINFVAYSLYKFHCKDSVQQHKAHLCQAIHIRICKNIGFEAGRQHVWQVQ